MSVQRSGICDVTSRNTSPGKGTQLRSILSNAMLHCDNDDIILGCNNCEDHLLTLEAIFQHEIRPKTIEKEFRTKTLSIIF